MSTGLALSVLVALSGALPTYRPVHRLGAQARPGVRMMPTETKKKDPSPEEVTKKWGLEAGIFSALTSKEGSEKKEAMTTAKDLLAQYGAAYLLTSIPLALVSFATCYLLVDNGVDVPALLAKVGIEVSGSSEKVGTVAIAYAAHKAASPIRFPPTVALTPVVARLIGKKAEGAEGDA